ncbi:MAG TPA: CopG family transcriptional regulator [Bryobacteraceae bacterium]|nr:CopG family transcriptional regulator [Bryobacteraceae bacterium]
MRTTVTLEPDVERALKAAVRERGVSFKQALNEAVRAGLAHPRRGMKARFVQKTYSLGAEQNFRWDKALAAAEVLEDEELIRKLSLGK